MKKLQRQLKALVLAFGATALFACGGAADSALGGGSPTVSNGGGGNTGVSQPGAQDFGLFRQILEDGEIPTPDAIDALGFFAEHKLDYPDATCGNDLCLHGLLGVQGNLITGANCTMVQLGMNSPIRIEDLNRPPMHLVLAIDVSGSMRGDPIRYVKQGLTDMVDQLRPEDLVTVVTYSTDAAIVVPTSSVADGTALKAAFARLQAQGSTNIFDGLFTALQASDSQLKTSWQNRVILLSDGVATAGITDVGRMRALAAGYAKKGIGITTIGVGTDFDVGLMRDIGEVGAGNFYFLENPAAAAEVFTEEVNTFLYPIAHDVEISVSAGSGYALRRVFGTNSYTGGTLSGSIELPTLFLAGRLRASDPIEGGRRGGGGAIMIELLPKSDQANVIEPLRVADLRIAFTDPRSGQRISQSIDIDNSELPGVIPENGLFTNPTVAKGFIMLNIFAGFELAAQLSEDADVGAARGVLQNLRDGVEAWLETNVDPDIEDDLRYIKLFETNLANVPQQTPISRPPEPFPISD